MSIGISNSSLVREFDEEINDDTQGSYETGGDDDLTPDADIAFIVLCIFAVVILGGLLTVISKRPAEIKTYFRRRKDFLKAPPKAAVSAIYGFMESRDYPLKDETVRLGNKAAYGGIPMEEEDRKVMLTYLKDAEKRKRRIKREDHIDYENKKSVKPT